MDKFIKIGFGVLAGFALIFGFWRLNQDLKLSFIEDTANAVKNEQSLMNETKQKMTDSDVDGLSDWDELNIYGTSPYLKDSDSDGVIDPEEIKNNTDPNCPVGQICGSALSPTTGTNDEVGAATTTAASSLTTEESAALQTELNNLSSEEIRALLKQGGVSDSDLQAASDEDLRNLLKEVMQQSQ